MLATSSGDSTVKIWSFENLHVLLWKIIKETENISSQHLQNEIFFFFYKYVSATIPNKTSEDKTFLLDVKHPCFD